MRGEALKIRLTSEEKDEMWGKITQQVASTINIADA